MKKSKGIVVLLLTLILTVFFCFTAAVGIGPTGTGAAKHINTGLDLAGGVSITYQAKESNPTSEEMSDTIYKLQKRVEQYSTEAQVYQEGSDRITVEIPGVTDADTILNDLGKPGSLYFITKEDADGNQNFTTGQDGYVLSRTMDEIKESGSVVLEGSDVADAQGGAIQNQNTSAKEYVVSLTLTSDGENSGKTKFAEATKNNVGKQIAIVYDNDIISAPNVNEEISGGKAQISGMSDLEEAQNLASYIRIGSLGLELEELRSSVVAAQLGEEAISTSVLAGAIGLIIVIIFMIIAYRVPGVVAGIALILYTSLMLITLNAFDITLTLPGIAGIILGIGMAVDANVIIYARIREEIGAGVSVRNSIKSGFSKAFSAIFDGNITTLIAAFVLMWLGSGTVKGFAYTLALGIVISMFTALVVSRLIVNALYAVGVRDPKFYGSAKERKAVDFLGKKKVFFAISIILILCGPAAMFANSHAGNKALNYSLEFSGGTSTTVTFNEDMDIKTIDSGLGRCVGGSARRMGAGGADRVVRAGAGRACAWPFLRGAHRAAGGGQPYGHVHDDFHRADRRVGLLPEAAQAFGRSHRRHRHGVLVGAAVHPGDGRGVRSRARRPMGARCFVCRGQPVGTAARVADGADSPVCRVVPACRFAGCRHGRALLRRP